MLKSATEENISLRKVENILCKFFRHIGGGDTKWKDCLIAGQCLFVFDEDSCTVLAHGQVALTLSGPNVINYWPFASMLTPMSAIIASLGLPESLPSDEIVGRYCLPLGVAVPQGGVNLEFPMPPTVLTDEAKRATRTLLRRMGIK